MVDDRELSLRQCVLQRDVQPLPVSATRRFESSEYSFQFEFQLCLPEWEHRARRSARRCLHREAQWSRASRPNSAGAQRFWEPFAGPLPFGSCHSFSGSRDQRFVPMHNRSDMESARTETAARDTFAWFALQAFIEVPGREPVQGCSPFRTSLWAVLPIYPVPGLSSHPAPLARNVRAAL